MWQFKSPLMTVGGS